MTRAERGARLARQKARVKRLFICWNTEDAALVGRLARTRRPCSCLYCHGHMRTDDGPTVQERKAALDDLWP